MKITGGIASGIPIQVLKGDRTRPTTDRIRESVFSRLQAFVPGKRVLDLFAGSGALGLDAASRGAASVLFVEQHAATANLISQNARRLAPAGVTSDFRVLTLDVYRFLRNPAGVKVDLIFADPPYAYLQKEQGFESLLSAIHAADLLTEDGVLVVESGARIPLPDLSGWTLTKDKAFGSSRISFWVPGNAGTLPASLGARASLPATDDAGILPASLGARASLPATDDAGRMPAVPGTGDTRAPGRWHSRGYLPHFDKPGLVQFITFRLFDSVPVCVINSWQTELDWTEDVEADDPRAAELRKRIAAYEDAGYGECWLRHPDCAAVVQNALLHFDAQRYFLIEWCVMPNHVHVLIETIDDHALEKIVHSWKSFTSSSCNRILDRKGRFWMPEYFDRFIQGPNHYDSVVDYIRQNPVKAGLCTCPEDWSWSSLGTRASMPAILSD